MFKRHFAGSLRDLTYINEAYGGALSAVEVFLNNGTSFTGSIAVINSSHSDSFSVALDTTGTREFIFGKTPEQVGSVTCRGEPIHVDRFCDEFRLQPSLR